MKIAVLMANKRESALICEILAGRGHACDALSQRDVAQGLGEHLLAVADLRHARLVLPGLRAAREQGLRLPLLLVADGDEQADIIPALADGADDFLIRPVRRAELAVRVSILLRRFHPQPQQREVFGDYEFDPVERRVQLKARPVSLTQKEFELALLFFRHLGRPLSRAFLQEAVWPGQEDAGRTVDTHVSRVRTRLGLKPENGFRLVPVYSFGYRLERIGG